MENNKKMIKTYTFGNIQDEKKHGVWLYTHNLNEGMEIIADSMAGEEYYVELGSMTVEDYVNTNVLNLSVEDINKINKEFGTTFNAEELLDGMTY